LVILPQRKGRVKVAEEYMGFTAKEGKRGVKGAEGWLGLYHKGREEECEGRGKFKMENGKWKMWGLANLCHTLAEHCDTMDLSHPGLKPPGSTRFRNAYSKRFCTMG
jgi:hypothetical protein